MISRLAEHCFWFGRYLERTESAARLLQAARAMELDGELSTIQCWLPTIIVAGEEDEFGKKHGAESAGESELVQRYLTWDEDSGVSVARSISAARWNARTIRESLSLEVWETVNELHLWMESGAGRAEYERSATQFYEHIRTTMQLCLGRMRSTMLHDLPLLFIRTGGLLERAGQTARVLDVHHHALTHLVPRDEEEHHQVVDAALWLSLLRALSGLEAFMKTHHGLVDGRSVATFLLLEPRFPRSVRYGLRTAIECFYAIRPPERDDLPGGVNQARLRELDRRLAELTSADLDPGPLHDVLTHVVDETSEICVGIGRELFGHDDDADADNDEINAAISDENQ